MGSTLVTLLAICSWAWAASDSQRHTEAFPDRAIHAVLCAVSPVSPDTDFLQASKHPFDNPRVGPRLTKGMFLVASRGLVDPNFRRSVVLLVAHDEDGAMGVIVNRRTDLTLSTVLPDIEELADRPDQLFVGGPVASTQIILLLRAADPPRNSQHVFNDVYFSGSLTTLMDYLEDQDLVGAMHAYAGYAGWAPGQLEGELERGDWNLVSADAETVFSESPEEMWPELIRQSSGLWVRGAQHRPVRHAVATEFPVGHRE